MNIAMIRIFDNVGYYETRFILMIFALAAALFFLAKKKDRNYLVMFISGAVWQSVMSLVVMNMTLRGQEYSLLLFGFQVPSVLIWLIQGVFEGGIHGLMGYWFLDVYINRGSDQKQGLDAVHECFDFCTGDVVGCRLLKPGTVDYVCKADVQAWTYSGNVLCDLYHAGYCRAERRRDFPFALCLFYRNTDLLTCQSRAPPPAWCSIHWLWNTRR